MVKKKISLRLKKNVVKLSPKDTVKKNLTNKKKISQKKCLQKKNIDKSKNFEKKKFAKKNKPQLLKHKIN